MEIYDVVVVGGGAAGFFTAINCAEIHPNKSIVILERGKDVLTKVKISGGGRCNVTHAEFVPQELIENYPRGKKELLGPFHQFMTGDTMAWFEDRGVPIKIESDGRCFPKSNSSQSIIDCFLMLSKSLGIKIFKNHSVKSIGFKNEEWIVETPLKKIGAKKIVIATGSNPKIWNMLEALGHTIVPPVPSLFTFNCTDNRIKNIPGVVAQHVEIKLLDKTNFVSSGPLLITHKGLSGPAVLKLSAFEARTMAKSSYEETIEINFICESKAVCLERLKEIKHEKARKTAFSTPCFGLPKRLWHNLVEASGINHSQNWATLTNKLLENLSNQLTHSSFLIDGKSTFKEEFVTAGGVDLKEINFKTFESKCCKNLFLAGEVLNIDAITGGFNFQNAWTGGFVIARSLFDLD